MNNNYHSETMLSGNDDIWVEFITSQGLCYCTSPIHCEELAEYRRAYARYLYEYMPHVKTTIKRIRNSLHHLAGYDGKTM